MVHQFTSDILTALHPPIRFVNPTLRSSTRPLPLLGVPYPSSIIETFGGSTTPFKSPLPCTLIVLPCDLNLDLGDITSFSVLPDLPNQWFALFNPLKTYDLPVPRNPMSAESIEFIQLVHTNCTVQATHSPVRCEESNGPGDDEVE